MKLIRSIATVGFFTIASRIFGFVRTILTASYLGAGAISDALEIAIKLPSFLRRLFAEGAFNATFIPLFAGTLSTKGKGKAKSMAEEILAVFIISLLGIVVFVELFMDYLVPLLLPGFLETPERLLYTIEFSRITFPFILFISLTALYGGILNSLDKFSAVASSPMAGNIVIIATVYVFSQMLKTPGHAFALGVLLCGIVQFLWVWVPALKVRLSLSLIVPKITPNVKVFLLKLGPAAASSGVVQLNILVGMLIASYLPEGGVSYLSYADRLNQLPLSVIGTAIGTALLPVLSRQIRSGKQSQALKTQNEALEIALLLTLPATVGLIVLAHPLIVVLFERNAFNAQSSLATSQALMAFAVGLPAYILTKVFSSCFFAYEDTRTPLKAAVFAVGIDIILSILFLRMFEHVGIALATALSAWVNALTMGYLLLKKGYLVIERRLKILTLKYIIIAFATALYLYLIKPSFTPWLYQGVMEKIGALSLLIFSGIAVFLTLAKLWGVIHFGKLRLSFRQREAS